MAATEAFNFMVVCALAVYQVHHYMASMVSGLISLLMLRNSILWERT